MPFRQRERGSGSAVTVPTYVRIQDGDSTTLADVEASQIIIVDRGVANGTQTATTLVCSDKNWTVDALIDMTVIIHTESANTEAKTITDNDATSVTVGSSWANNPVDDVTHFEIRTSRNALVVKLTGAAFDIDELNMEVNPKTGHYKDGWVALGDNQDSQFHLAQYGVQITSELDVSEASEAWTWNADGTMATYAITIGGKTFTRTYVWNADGTVASSSMAVS